MTEDKVQLTRNILSNFTDVWNFLQNDCDGEINVIEKTVFWVDDQFLRIDISGCLEHPYFNQLKKKLKQRFDKVKIKINEKEKDGEYLWFWFSGSVFTSLENLWRDSK